MTSETFTADDEVARLNRRLNRERATRRAAESIAEKGLRDLYSRQLELELLERIAASANQSHSAREALQFAIEQVCIACYWDAGHGYLVTGAKPVTRLKSAGTWYAAERAALDPYRRACEAWEFTQGVGLPGRALETGKPVWVADLAVDANFPRLDIARQCGLRSAMCFPVMSGEDVVAVLEFFGVRARAPDAAMLVLMAQIGTQLGRVVERQRAEQALKDQTAELIRARDAATSADRAKSTFLANMSHELRTPLNAIIGFAELIEAERAGPLGETYKSYIADIHNAGVHLKDILNDILDLSKIEVGALELRESVVNPKGIAEACYRTVMPLADAAGVKLSCDVAADVPELLGDEQRLKQAVLNLLSNAVKFTPAGGSVTLGLARAGANLAFVVADTGIGIAAEDIATALEPFRQVDHALSRRYEGTGLGLPIAKAFAGLHGGSLAIASEPGLGTLVTLTLPASRLARA
jgi:signal transduction histidine kinase